MISCHGKTIMVYCFDHVVVNNTRCPKGACFDDSVVPTNIGFYIDPVSLLEARQYYVRPTV